MVVLDVHDLIHHAHDADDFGAQHHRHKLRALITLIKMARIWITPMVRTTIFEVIRFLSKVTAPECSGTYIRPRSWGIPLSPIIAGAPAHPYTMQPTLP
jgi:hypothetical protein